MGMFCVAKINEQATNARQKSLVSNICVSGFVSFFLTAGIRSTATADAEAISLAVNYLNEIGLNDLDVEINSLGCPVCREEYKTKLKEVLKPYLAELCPDCQKRYEKNPLRLLDCKVEECKEIYDIPQVKEVITSNFICEDCNQHFEDVKKYLTLLEVDYEVDTRLVRGLDYYNHTVFEIEAKVDGFGSNNVLAGGGRYNGLVDLLGGPATPGIGFALGMGRLLMALDLEKIDLPINNSLDAFIMYVSESEKEIPDGILMASGSELAITLEAKEEAHRMRTDAEREVKERRAEIQRAERRMIQKEESLDKKLENIEKREESITKSKRK